MSDDEKKPTPAQRRKRMRAWYADLFSGMPDGYTPLEAVVSVRCLAEDGNVCLVNMKTRGLAPWDAYGMLSFALDDFSSPSLATPSDEE